MAAAASSGPARPGLPGKLLVACRPVAEPWASSSGSSGSWWAPASRSERTACAVRMTALFLLLAVCLLHWVPPQQRLSATIAVCFAVIGATVLVTDYGTQLTVLQPALLTGETEGLSASTMYNPHGVFIALENVGYAVIGVAFVFLGGALAGGSSRLERAVRWVFTVGGVLILATLVLFAAIYRAELDYRFEVMSLSITWLVLIVSGTLLTIVFGRALKVATQRPAGVTTDALAGR